MASFFLTIILDTRWATETKIWLIFFFYPTGSINTMLMDQAAKLKVCLGCIYKTAVGKSAILALFELNISDHLQIREEDPWKAVKPSALKERVGVSGSCV